MLQPEGGPRHLLKDPDLDPPTLRRILDDAAALKLARGRGGHGAGLRDRTVALLFEKPSTRTRGAFEVAIHDEGGQCTYFGPHDTHLGESESTEDTARVLGSYFDGIAFRGFEQETVEALAAHAGVPVWNALTDAWHPTQAIADLLTMREQTSNELAGVSVCFVGDGRDNVANSLLVSAAMLGMDVRIASPEALGPLPSVLSIAHLRAAQSGARVLVTDDLEEAIRGTDFLYTDIWVSMGEDRQLWAERIAALRPYRIDAATVARTGNPAVKILHCLPSVHDRNSGLGREIASTYGLEGVEIADEVFRSERSLVFEQAANKLHAAKAVILRSFSWLERGGSD